MSVPTQDKSEGFDTYTKRDMVEDIVLVILIFAAGLIVGHRVAVLERIYGDPEIDLVVPECSEDEYRDPDSFECVHIDLIG